VTLNYRLTKEVAQLKQDLVTKQQEHDHRTADLLAQIATKTQELETKTQEVKTYIKAREDLHDYYQERKKYWTKQHEDDQKKIDNLTETIKILMTNPARAP
jgi:thymidylate synthase